MENRFLKLTSEELACDAHFINLIKDTGNKDSWLVWLDNNPDQKEKIKIAKQLILLPYEKVEGIDKSTLWKRIDQTIQESSKGVNIKAINPTNSPIKYFKWAGMAAAVFAFVLITRPLFTDSGNRIIYASAQEQVLLPDQSLVTLNSDSELSYNKDKWSEERQLTLNGEAFFSVEKGQKFTVITSAGTVEVLGTSFNVFQRANAFSVECESGKVKVTHGASGKIFMLIPGDAVRVDQEGIATLKDMGQTQFRSNWREGQYNYRDQSLKDVFEEMERQYDITIKIDKDILKRKYTGYFEVDDLEKALESVLFPMRLKHSKSGNTINITSE